MKPGNLSEMKRCQIRRQTKDEDSIQHTSNASMCAFFVFVEMFYVVRRKKGNVKWKKDSLPLNV